MKYEENSDTILKLKSYKLLINYFQIVNKETSPFTLPFEGHNSFHYSGNDAESFLAANMSKPLSNVLLDAGESKQVLPACK